MCIYGWILGIGDRHLGNTLVCLKTGNCIGEIMLTKLLEAIRSKKFVLFLFTFVNLDITIVIMNI